MVPETRVLHTADGENLVILACTVFDWSTCVTDGRTELRWLRRVPQKLLSRVKMTKHSWCSRWQLQLIKMAQHTTYFTLCQEDEDTSLHFIAQCSALMLLHKNILGDYTISLDTLSDIHWFLLLKFAKASMRFCRPWGLSGLRTGPMKWPQRWVAAPVVTLPAGKGKGKGNNIFHIRLFSTVHLRDPRMGFGLHFYYTNI